MARNPILWVLPARGVVSVVKTRMQTTSVATAAVGSSPPLLLRVAGDILGSLAGNVGDMSATRQNVANFCPDRPILVT